MSHRDKGGLRRRFEEQILKMVNYSLGDTRINPRGIRRWIYICNMNNMDNYS